MTTSTRFREFETYSSFFLLKFSKQILSKERYIFILYIILVLVYPYVVVGIFCFSMDERWPPQEKTTDDE